MNVTWIEFAAVIAIHNSEIAEHGGSEGVRDEGLLLSALARPQNTFAYNDEADISNLAAAYAFGIAKNHAFVDGNKRTAYVVMRTFLQVNEHNIVATPEEKYIAILGLAESNISEEEFAKWVRDHLVELP